MTPEMFLTREFQFCVLCYGAKRGWVRIANAADLIEIRKGRNERAALKVYRARRRRAIVAHLKVEHPSTLFRTRASA
jgi:hypothetical protein